jgi:hypothetical protein
MPPAGFEPAIPASEWPQTHALDRADTVIGNNNNNNNNNNLRPAVHILMKKAVLVNVCRTVRKFWAEQ